MARRPNAQVGRRVSETAGGTSLGQPEDANPPGKLPGRGPSRGAPVLFPSFVVGTMRSYPHRCERRTPWLGERGYVLTERQKLKTLKALVAQGDRLGYGQKPEVQKYPVLGAVGAVSQQQRETMAFHLDAMAEGEWERVVASLMDIGMHEQTSVLATLAGMPLMPGGSPPDPERFPYLSRQAFHGPAQPRYRKS